LHEADRVSTVSSLVAGTLFALSPYALYRNIDHFWMVIYLVPFPCTAALLLGSGRLVERPLSRSQTLAILVGCAALGFNYVYYSFFACFLIGLATAVGWIAIRRTRLAAAGIICVTLIGATTALNLAPSLYSWSRNGRPLILREKVAAESEVYGLKIRQLISPVFQHRFPPFRAWNNRESAARFPLETENMTSRLGLVGSIGFLGLLALLFIPNRRGALAWTARCAPRVS
jgi:phosphoglycerol transferase